ncbi:MAG TPA: secretin N-terminal domain-containing protein [Candidatus Hydrogenedentes bacterium]|nr:secretin N-terminal domain-containing protein [Candidatus Hydrogenedentota bacterium]HRT19524.1 secretin N-terminal domain-containing protein [Candidatus Hydrogenedentota bacterium]HRT64220.1 secretin N-terminal domain-containing protein [Candidatus Hydrogenedentota bacterium]
MIPTGKMTKRIAIGLAALGLAVAGMAHAQQSPTQPKATPELNRLRQQLQQSLRSAQQGSRQTGTATGEAEAPPGPRAGQPAQERTVTAGISGPTQVVQGGQQGAASAARGTLSSQQTGAAGKSAGRQGGAGAAAPMVRVLGPNTYDPIIEKLLEYKDVPDVGEPMTLNGPLTVKDFLETLSMATNWNILVTEEAQKVNLQFWITDTKPRDALEILKFHDLYYEYNEENKYLYVTTKVERLDKQYGALQEYEISIQHAPADHVESLIGSLMSPKGRAVTDPRTGHIFVWDTAENIAKMKEAVERLDVPMEEAEFTIKHADAADIEPILSTMLSPSGTLVVDPRTGHVLARDLRENLDQMAAAVEKFDVPIESKVFPVKYVSVDNLVDSIESILSARGKAMVDPHTNTLIVSDVASRQDMVARMVEALDQKLDTRTWVLNYINAEDVADRLERLVPEEMGDIIVDDDVHQLTVTALVERLDEIDRLIKSWDVKRRQVQIEAYMAQISSELARNLNVSWTFMDSTGNAPQALQFGGGAKPDFSSLSNTLTIGQLAYPIYLRDAAGEIIKDVNGKPIIEKFSGNRVGAVLNYLDTRNEAKIIAAPRVTVQDGEEAIFQSGRRVPYVTSTTYGSYPYSYAGNITGTAGSTVNPYYNSYYGYGSQPYNRIDFIEVGTILNVLPRITEDNSILLDISAEDSDATPKTVISQGQENTIPEKSESRAETQVRVNNGDTIVIGGLRKGTDTRSLSKSLPLLGDIPILGRLFRNPSKSIKNAMLMIFITTTIVDEKTHPETEHLAQFDEAFSADLRKAKRNEFKDIGHAIRRGRNEIVVAVGQSGAIRSNGKRAGLDDLERSFAQVSSPATTVVVLRKHLRAPEDVIRKITDLALEHRLKVELDSDTMAFVANPPAPPSVDAPADAEQPGTQSPPLEEQAPETPAAPETQDAQPAEP